MIALVAIPHLEETKAIATQVRNLIFAMRQYEYQSHLEYTPIDFLPR
jgi:hypothetical protein